MGHQLYIPLYCNRWGMARGILSPYLFAVYLDGLSDHLGSARVGCTVGYIWLWIIQYLLMIYACSTPVGLLADANVFWIFVVTMLLNTKSLLIVRKQLMFFCPKQYKQPAPSNVFLNGVRESLVSWLSRIVDSPPVYNQPCVKAQKIFHFFIVYIL